MSAGIASVARGRIVRRRIGDLLLQAYSNAEMAKELGCKVRTVTVQMTTMFQEHGITGGNKRVRLAVSIYRERQRANEKIHVVTSVEHDGSRAVSL